MAFQGEYILGSKQFPGSFLRMDGNGVNSFEPSGGGTVNCQFFLGIPSAMTPWERYFLYLETDGSYYFKSKQFGTYLRMDGTGVNSFAPNGAGTVNCQFTVGPWEKFLIEYQGDGSCCIKSQNFGTYLRMDGTGVNSFAPNGAGTVNCQFTAGPYEKFILTPLAQP